jgi:hypothetical protein
MPNDPKWRVVARRSKRPVHEVISVFVFMLNDAADWSHRGCLENWNDEVVGAALDLDAECVESIRAAMQGLVLDGDKISGWDKRQPKREDLSTERVKVFRERQKSEMKRNETRFRPDETQRNAPEEKRIDKKEPLIEIQVTSLEGLRQSRPAAPVSNSKALAANSAAEAFSRFWALWPHKVGKPAAASAFRKVACEADAIIAGVERYVRDKPPDRPWLNPSTFLNQCRWEDEPASVSQCEQRGNGKAELYLEILANEQQQNDVPSRNVLGFPVIQAKRN